MPSEKIPGTYIIIVRAVIFDFCLGQSTHRKFMSGQALVFVVPLTFAFLMEQWMLHYVWKTMLPCCHS